MPNYPSRLQHFYINEEQSIYLMSHQDAQKIKDWLQLCQEQLEQHGFSKIEFIGKGAYGFVFGGVSGSGSPYVFKFSRINLPQHIQDRLEEEAWMQQHLDHPNIPVVNEYTRIKKQSVLIMERAKGMDLEQFSLKYGPLPPRLVVKIAAQMRDILVALRSFKQGSIPKPIVHGDIKPSNIVIDPETETVKLIDWGSSVFAQLDAQGQPVADTGISMMSADHHNTNAKLGDVYFIGEEQLNGALSSPRFDEQGVAGTLYALASGQSCRYGHNAIPPSSLGLPIEFARTLQAMLDDDLKKQHQAGDYFIKQMQTMRHLVFADDVWAKPKPLIPVWSHDSSQLIDTVVYNSRKTFLREEQNDHYLMDVDDVELEKYYKNFMHGMGKTERAFLASISRLGKYPLVGGLAIHWNEQGVHIDSSLNLHAPALQDAFIASVNNFVNLARSIQRVGVFKCCMFNARVTLHIERESIEQPFQVPEGYEIPFEIAPTLPVEEPSRLHSYFEDGEDPEELLQLPKAIRHQIERLNSIRHTGCIIFESLPNHLKIHSYYVLLDAERESDFKQALSIILDHVHLIDNLGISGFMKLPYKNTRSFSHLASQPDHFYPRNPRGA
ncbi:serine/threonine protein kinase [Oceanospirillum multiglobuliferum]|uniref:Serine/threonine protein kinase n=1 Tax=Oceanospirillum multiglobuliferum TaxID=64969 RepID=A0A1T4SLJ2_9GAMM|nr:protein kinase [Oceanospirillum multiglobuliferum]OPX54161.1 serine/threonine protein kinase [Oceanospirillum multiglobuliferum]SKA29184.1 serine/threonine protein kinase [Oceanospirillum multiglobuliferum]